MSTIKTLFDPGKPIDRRIEKVIQYSSENEPLLKQEITEYVATDNIQENFFKILDQLEEGMGGDQEHEVGIWVSGFYGSGKSSFTKYLGLAFDPKASLERRPFIEWLKDQFRSDALKTRFSTVAKRFPMTVILLDLSTDALTGHSMLPVSTVLYYKVLDWAGYSRERKIAHLELRLEKDNKLQEFQSIIHDMSGETWEEIKHDVMAAGTYAGKAASKLYPKLWPEPKDFDSLKIDEVETEAERVEKMLEVIEKKSGSKNVLFVIDEVGQYVAPDDDRITNLQGLAQNIKRLGLGHCWIMATAQQTLTEDDTRAAVNTPKLFKLKDRFPISIDLEASDIREICYERLLGKSAEGKRILEELFTKYGEQLKHHTKLDAGKGYSSHLDKDSFVSLYPFLPQHFDILLKILGKLAKTTGGVGLRSAIKVIQDILVDTSEKKDPLSEKSIGSLATTVSLYDTLKRDIEKSFQHIIEGVRVVEKAFKKSTLHINIAKTVAVMQILDDFPLSRKNIASLLYPSVDEQPKVDEIEKAIDELISESTVPLNEVDEKIKFMSEQVNELEKIRATYIPKQSDERIILTNALTSLFHPQPQTVIHGTKKVMCGLKYMFSGHPVPILGDREEIQLIIELEESASFQATRKEYITESVRQPMSKSIYCIGYLDDAMDEMIAEIHRCEKIFAYARNQTMDKDVNEYASGQNQRAERLRAQLRTIIEKGVGNGSFVFRGQETSVKVAGSKLLEAVGKMLHAAGEEVFKKYPNAPVQADGGLAERFIKSKDLSSVASKDDPLELTKSGSAQTPINTEHPAVKDIKDYLDMNGTVNGSRLMEDFARSPYGWSKDTTRYVAAAMLAAGEVKFRINNKDVMARLEEEAIGAVKSVANFNKIGIGLRETSPDPEKMLEASERLLKITGEEVTALEESITHAVLSYFPGLQYDFARLPSHLKNLNLPGNERAEQLLNEISYLISSPTDAVERFGGESSNMYEDIVWAKELSKAFDNKIDTTISKIKEMVEGIEKFSGTDILPMLIENTAEGRDSVKNILQEDDFYTKQTELQQNLSLLSREIEKAAKDIEEEQKDFVQKEKKRITSLHAWPELGEEDRERYLDIFDNLVPKIEYNLNGIMGVIQNRYSISQKISDIDNEIMAHTKKKPWPETAASSGEGGEITIPVPGYITTVNEAEEVITALQKGKREIPAGKTLRIKVR